MIIAIQHYLEDTVTFQNDCYQNVASILWEYQPTNGIDGSYWLTLKFKKGTQEAADFKYGEIAICIDPKQDTFQIYRDSH